MKIEKELHRIYLILENEESISQEKSIIAQ